MSLMHAAWQPWQAPATYVFLVFAQAVWPLYIPLCILIFEPAEGRRKLITLLLICGAGLALYICYALWQYPQYAVTEQHHIRYIQHFALAQQWFYGVLYFLPTIVAPMVSSHKDLRWLGYLFLIAYAATRLLFHFYEVSVWCFFGAVISVIVTVLINRHAKNGPLVRRTR